MSPHPCPHTPPRLLPQRLHTKHPGGGLHVWLLAWARVNTVSHNAPRAADTGEHFEARQCPVALATISQVSAGRTLPCAYIHSPPAPPRTGPLPSYRCRSKGPPLLGPALSQIVVNSIAATLGPLGFHLLSVHTCNTPSHLCMVPTACAGHESHWRARRWQLQEASSGEHTAECERAGGGLPDDETHTGKGTH